MDLAQPHTRQSRAIDFRRHVGGSAILARGSGEVSAIVELVRPEEDDRDSLGALGKTFDDPLVDRPDSVPPTLGPPHPTPLSQQPQLEVALSRLGEAPELTDGIVESAEGDFELRLLTECTSCVRRIFSTRSFTA